MNVASISPILNVSSIADSIAWFESLGWQRTFTWNAAGLIGQGPSAEFANASGQADFAGVRSADCTILLCLDGQGPRDTQDSKANDSGVWMSWWLKTRSEVESAWETAKKLGVETDGPPRDEPWGVLEFQLRHPDGHCFRISCGS